MYTSTSFTEIHYDITAICPICQDAVIAHPVEERIEAGVAQVRGLGCSRCYYDIELAVRWKPRLWHTLVK